MSHYLGPKSLVVGGDSTIGRALAKHLHKQSYQVIKTSRRPPLAEGESYLDLSLPNTWHNLPKNITVAFLCAAQTSFEKCRLYPAEARAINVIQPVALTKALLASGARVIFLSTNCVYNGSKPYPKIEDPVCPLNEYGRLKAEAEEQLLSLKENVTIVRLTKVLTRQLPLIEGWIQSLKEGTPIHPFLDLTTPPLSLEFLTDILSRLINTTYSGILQLSGSLDVSYASIAQQIAIQLNADPQLVQPIKSPTDSSRSIDKQPANLTLDTTTLRHLFQLEAPSLTEVVKAVLKEEPSPD